MHLPPNVAFAHAVNFLKREQTRTEQEQNTPTRRLSKKSAASQELEILPTTFLLHPSFCKHLPRLR